MTDAERHPVDDVPPTDADDLDDGETATPPADPDTSSDAAAGDDDDAATIGTEIATSAEDDPRSREELLAELLEAEARRDEYLDDLRRARAEFENFRRRTMREGATQRELGRVEVLTGMLEVLDDLDRTLEAADASQDASLAKGIGLVAGKLVQALQAQGLERVDETAVAFDPNQHEAVQQVESDRSDGSPEPIVAQVLRPGYRLGDRVLRAAMVVVEQ